MKYEFVEFYPLPESIKKKNPRGSMVGTVHIYCIDHNFDIRGIRVSIAKKGTFFQIPHFRTIDHETGEAVSYPLFSWTNREDHKGLMDFLHQVVKPEVKKILDSKSKK